MWGRVIGIDDYYELEPLVVERLLNVAMFPCLVAVAVASMTSVTVPVSVTSVAVVAVIVPTVAVVVIPITRELAAVVVPVTTVLRIPAGIVVLEIIIRYRFRNVVTTAVAVVIRTIV